MRAMDTARVALVTGAGRGIGRAISLELARQGWDIALGWVRDEAAATAAAAEIRALGRRAALVRTDAADPADCADAVAATVAALGRLDAAVANAGIAERGSFLDTPPDVWERQLTVNARGSFFLAQAAARQMVAQGGGGRIVLITSQAGGKPMPGIGAYCVSKAAQRMVAKVAAAELAEHGITVNEVAPGTTETDINRDILGDPVRRAAAVAPILLGRPGIPDDICGAVAFLLSDQAAWITGATIDVNGGSLIR